MDGQRRQPTFLKATSGSLTSEKRLQKVRIDKVKLPRPIRSTSQIWVVTRHSFLDLIRGGNQRWNREMLAVFSAN